MIKAFLLVLDPAATWDRIVLAKRNWPVIFLGYLLPLWLIGAVAEGYGLVHWGKPHGVVSLVKTFPNSAAVLFEIIQLLLFSLVVLAGAKVIKALGETFHGRNNFNQTFTTVAYGLSTVFAMHIFDMFPGVSGWLYWATWVVGILMMMSILYHGIPKVMLPDPPHAFGLYLTSTVLLTMISGLVRFLTFCYLEGKFGKLDALMAKIAAHLPFLQALDKYHF